MQDSDPDTLPATFEALVVHERPDGRFERAVETRRIDDLPPGDVLVRVRYSSLNFKDALSASGNKGVTRCYPHTPGIDAAGVVAASSAPGFAPGDEVLVTGYDLGMNTAGGFGEYIRVPGGWVVPLPSGLSLREAMGLGTAGITAAQCVDALVTGGVPAGATVLVTGATGGVGCMAVMLAHQAGYRVTAATGKRDAAAWLRERGADAIQDRDALLQQPDRPLLKGAWGGAIDTVGGAFLDGALRATGPHGVVAACGNAASPELHTNVYPFILRGVRLQGIDSANLPMDQRLVLWERLAGPWRPPQLEQILTAATLHTLDGHIATMLAGGLRGRVVVDV